MTQGRLFGMINCKLAVKIGKLMLKNPILTASGTFGYADEFKDLVSLNEIGAIITKTITLNPRQGNPPPRVIETSSGMLNSIGLENDGTDNFIREKLPFLKKLGTQVIVSISGGGSSDYAELAKRLTDAGVSALELNLSCPNIRVSKSQSVKESKLISQDKKATYEVVKAVRKAVKATVIAKLTPNVTDIAEIASSAEDAGADSVSLVNTFLAMSIDINTRRPCLGNVTGGLSGPAIKPIALRMVWETAQKVKIPVIGIGGIMNAEDALEFIIAGAHAVEVGTANFVNPKATTDIIDGIKDYTHKNKIRDIGELRGSINVNDK